MKRRRKLKIPAQFELLGHVINVIWADIHESEDAWGMFEADKMLITLDNSIKGKSLAEETFCHEKVEAMNILGELELEHPKIQQLGAMMHQAEITTYCPRKGKKNVDSVPSSKQGIQGELGESVQKEGERE